MQICISIKFNSKLLNLIQITMCYSKSINERSDLTIWRFLHLQVCNVSKMINQIFNAQILIYTFAQLLYSCVCIYYVYMETRRKNNFINALALEIVYLLDSIVGVLKIAVMSIDCEYAMKQVGNLVYHSFESCVWIFLSNYIFVSY